MQNILTFFLNCCILLSNKMWGGNVNVSLETLITNVSRYNISGIDKIKKAYEYAKLKHAGQYRESGEEYITHPLAVAIILARLNADTDTICAGLLHDVIEDTNTTKEDIAAEFGESVAILVMGVTNLTKMSISDKNSLNNANLRKLILGMTKDVRILIIKLADRLHNMMTLQYKKNPEKQQRKSLETFDIYVPIAENLGLYSVKNDLEDKCFMFLMPDKYYKVEEERKSIEESTSKMVQEVITKINDILTDNNIPNTVKFRLKNIYGIFKSLFSNDSLEDIHDLLAFKIILDDIDDCYLSLKYIHSEYKPLTNYFQDYISWPKSNNYQALHTTVLGPDRKILQMQMKTAKMEKISEYGITDYWHGDDKTGFIEMQKALKTEYPFFQSVIEANKLANNNQEFIDLIKGEVFAEKVSVFTMDGKVINDLAKGSTVIDFAYRIHSEIGDHAVAAIVNGESVSFDYTLKDGDQIRIITDELALGPTHEWLKYAKTARARKKIREFLNKQKRNGQSRTRSL